MMFTPECCDRHILRGRPIWYNFCYNCLYDNPAASFIDHYSLTPEFVEAEREIDELDSFEKWDKYVHYPAVERGIKSMFLKIYARKNYNEL